MLDIKFVRENPDIVKENIRKKFQNAKLPLVDEAIALDAQRRQAIADGEALKAERNKLSKANGPLFGKLKKCTDEAEKAAIQAQIDANNAAVKADADRMATLEAQKEQAEAALNKIMLVIPQIIDESVPIGPDDSCNVEVERFGEPKTPDFEVPYHTNIMERFDGIDLDAAGRVSGSGFYYLLGDIARLHEAVLAYARDFMIDKGFTYCIPPFMIHGNVVEGVMSQTDMDAMMYKIEGEDLYLIGTSEHSMIGKFIDQLPARPTVAAFTATATERVRGDIVRLLGLRDPYQAVTGFDRPNLHFAVERLEPNKKLNRITTYAKAHPEDSGVVYCNTRKNVEKVHEHLVQSGVKATRYHAGLGKEERNANQQAWINDDAAVIVATNAFGMGIDKSNVRYVIHYNMPASIEAYYQEAGRAGRDGLASECMLYWSDGDLSTCRFFLEQDSGNEGMSPEEAEVARAARRRMLAAMEGYCLTCECLRGYMLRYFGDEAAVKQSPQRSRTTARATTARTAKVGSGQWTSPRKRVLSCVACRSCVEGSVRAWW